MRKKKWLVIGVGLAILLVGALLFSYNWYGKRMVSGKYYIVDCDEFPNAYIEVKEGKLFIYNMDLNLKYRSYQLETYYKIEQNDDIDLKYGFSEEELSYISNLNNYFMNEGFEIDSVEPIKDGTFLYWYPCNINDTVFGLSFTYDSLNKTIKINNFQYVVEFKREKDEK